jgi:hypothetical protein
MYLQHWYSTHIAYIVHNFTKLGDDSVQRSVLRRNHLKELSHSYNARDV